MSATAIDQISSHLEGYLSKHGSVLPALGSHHLSLFTDTITKNEWSKRVLHHNFRSMVENTSDLIAFLKNFSSEGGAMFWEVGKNGGDNISHIESLLLEIFNSTGYVSFGKFQVHVITRTIESCIHEPFGEVSHPHCGHGSNDIANIFIKNFGWVDGELIEKKGRLDSVARKPTVDEILQMIVDLINVRARNALEGK